MNYRADIEKYTAHVDDAAIAGIVKYCGIALQLRDASLVSCTDNVELDRIRKGFATKVLGLSEVECESVLKAVCERMKGDNSKSRVTFYYLMADLSGRMKTVT